MHHNIVRKWGVTPQYVYIYIYMVPSAKVLYLGFRPSRCGVVVDLADTWRFLTIGAPRLELCPFSFISPQAVIKQN